MNAHLQPRDLSPALAGEIMETVLIKGDLRYLSQEQRVIYHNAICEKIGLNPLTRPFAYIELNGKLTLYALKACTDQLRQIHGVSISILSHDLDGDLYSVHVKARDASGREDEDFGVVVLPPENRALDRANTMLKAVTKAKRRVTLSICGLGMLDESEMEDIPAGAKRHVTEIEPAESPVAAEPPAPRQKPGRKPRMVAEPPKRRLAADRRINDRYEAEIRQTRPQRAFDPDSDPEAERREKIAEMELGQDFLTMRDEMERVTSVEALHQWGDDNVDRVNRQPEGRKTSLRQLYMERLGELKPTSISWRAMAARRPPTGPSEPFVARGNPPPVDPHPKFEPFDELPDHSAPPKDDGLDIPPSLRRSRNEQPATYLDLVAAE